MESFKERLEPVSQARSIWLQSWVFSALSWHPTDIGAVIPPGKGDTQDSSYCGAWGRRHVRIWRRICDRYIHALLCAHITSALTYKKRLESVSWGLGPHEHCHSWRDGQLGKTTEEKENRFYAIILVKSQHVPNLLFTYQCVSGHLKTQCLIKYKIKILLYSFPHTKFFSHENSLH